MLKSYPITCDICGTTEQRWTEVIDPSSFSDKAEKKTLLVSFWCSKCKNPQIVRVKFERTVVDGLVGELIPIVECHLETNELLAPKEPQKSLTVRPKIKKPRGKNE